MIQTTLVTSPPFLARWPSTFEGCLYVSPLGTGPELLENLWGMCQERVWPSPKADIYWEIADDREKWPLIGVVRQVSRSTLSDGRPCIRAIVCGSPDVAGLGLSRSENHWIGVTQTYNPTSPWTFVPR